MGKISKYSNLYDKDGKLIRSVDSISGRLDDYTIEELENLVDELAKDETKRKSQLDGGDFKNRRLKYVSRYI